MNLLKTPNFNFPKTHFFHTSRHYNGTRIRPSATNPTPATPVLSRLPKLIKSEAQEVLFDYLHNTRSLQYTDAEHISNNCPTFLENLLSKVKYEEEVGLRRAFSRFLRYNPINEFEPFLESLGLSAGEIESLLRRDLMYLADDELMFENYHVLCNYGVPRSRIGRMYKEERWIFEYEYGVLGLKLRAYEELGLSMTTVVKLVSSCPALLVGGVNKDFVGVVEKLKGLGIQSGWLVGNLADGKVYNWDRMLELICFLEKIGCRNKDMGKLFKTSTHFLIEDSGKKVYVLFSFLLKLGMGPKDVLVLVLQSPRVLAGAFAKNLWQAVQFMYEIRMENKEIAKILRAHAQVLGTTSLKKPATVLYSDLKIGREKLREIIMEDPLNLISLASSSNECVNKAHSLKGGYVMEKTAFLRRIGYIENSEEMVKALNRLGGFGGRGDQLQERFDCLVNAGLDYHVVSKMIKQTPKVLNQSKDVIEMKIQYLVNHLGFPLESIEKFPAYLGYNIETIKLRFSMCVWLKEKGLEKPMTLSTVLACSEARFVKYYVFVHPEGPAEWERLKNS